MWILLLLHVSPTWTQLHIRGSMTCIRLVPAVYFRRRTCMGRPIECAASTEGTVEDDEVDEVFETKPRK